MDKSTRPGGLLFLLVCLLFVLPASSRQHFQNWIPNGNSVPHPCPSPGQENVWMGVGHWAAGGGGPRNPFGLDFQRNGYVYNRSLCMMDSDGDGIRNGVELGDPDCIWSWGETTHRPMGHPGICEPVDSSSCKRKNGNVCQTPTEMGPAIDCNDIVDRNAQPVDLVFKTTEVPNNETSYYCQTFNLTQLMKNNYSDFHIVADKPLLGNGHLVHHMLMYGCDEDSDIDYDSPKPCGMLAESQCKHTIAGWTLGGTGTCYDGIPAGTRVGRTGFKKVVLEVHWNNPRPEHGRNETPGMRLHLTTNLKKYDLGVITFGQAGLRIPPRQSRHRETSRCSSACTSQQITQTMNVVSAGMHMHYLGTAGAIQLYKNNGEIKTLANDTSYDYDDPATHDHDPAIQIMPGDEVQVDCTYDSSRMRETVYYGDATSDEMCYAYVTYYPKINFNYCIQHGTSLENCNEFNLSNIGGCEINSAYFNTTLDYIWYYCDRSGRKNCTPYCRSLLNPTWNPCVRDDTRRYIEYFLTKSENDADTINALRSCDPI